MPKQKITKEMVVTAAFEIAREKDGEIGQITVNSIAKKLSCSVQPIYTYCHSMEQLRKDVMEKAREYVKAFSASVFDKNDPFRSTGQAYLKLAKEEPNVFKMFMLSRRENIFSLQDLYEAEADPRIAGIISENLNISEENARQLHLNMIIYTIGIGAIFSASAPNMPADEIFSQQEYAYKAFLNQIIKGDTADE